MSKIKVKPLPRYWEIELVDPNKVDKLITPVIRMDGGCPSRAVRRAKRLLTRYAKDGQPGLYARVYGNRLLKDRTTYATPILVSLDLEAPVKGVTRQELEWWKHYTEGHLAVRQIIDKPYPFSGDCDDDVRLETEANSDE